MFYRFAGTIILILKKALLTFAVGNAFFAFILVQQDCSLLMLQMG